MHLAKIMKEYAEIIIILSTIFPLNNKQIITESITCRQIIRIAVSVEFLVVGENDKYTMKNRISEWDIQDVISIIIP